MRTTVVPAHRNNKCALLDSIGRHTSLQLLQIQADARNRLSHPGYTFALDSLFPLKDLAALLLYIPGFVMTEASIPECANHWPQLEQLALQPDYPTNSSPPALPLDALDKFAAHFPSLSLLAVDVDATSFAR